MKFDRYCVTRILAWLTTDAAIVSILAFGAFTRPLAAQWTQTSPHINNTNTGNVGIGTGPATPPARLTVAGSGVFGASGAAQFSLFNDLTGGNGYTFTQHLSDAGLWQLANAKTGSTAVTVNQAGDIGFSTTLLTLQSFTAPVVPANSKALFTVVGSGAYGTTGAAQFNLVNSGSNNTFAQHVSNTGAWQLADANVGATKLLVKKDLGGEVQINTGALIVQSYAGAIPVKFLDIHATGIADGVSMQMGGNSEIQVSNLQIGLTTLPVIQSVGPNNPLRLNKVSANDVVIGDAAHTTTGLQVASTGPSSFAGSVTVSGDLRVDGNVASKYQDVAEWVPTTAALSPGTVVVLDRERPNHVLPSAIPYDSAVAGVVSPRPGLALGEPSESKALVATMGRVRVRVDATAHPIEVGDLLVTSGRAGVAMKSIPLDVHGVPLHRPGTVVGKALERIDGGEGEILVLLSLQ